MTCLVAVLFQKCTDTLFIEFRRSSAIRAIVEVRVAVLEPRQPFPCCRTAYQALFEHLANIPRCFGYFSTKAKCEEEHVSEI